MKKKNYDLIIGLITVALAVFSVVIVREVTKPKPFKPLTTSITDQQIIEKMENQESFVFYVGSETCSACKAYRLVVNEYIKDHEQTFYYLDTKVFKTQAALEAFYADVLKTEPTTPQTFYVKDGEIVEHFIGSVSIDALNRFIERYQ